jgi:hypothetical protein
MRNSLLRTLPWLALPLLVPACDARIADVGGVSPVVQNAKPHGDPSAYDSQGYDSHTVGGAAPAAASAPAPSALPAAMSGRQAPPSATGCVASDDAPLTTEDQARSAGNVGLTGREFDPQERKLGLDRSFMLRANDRFTLGAELAAPIRNGLQIESGVADSDGDCLSDDDELKAGTNPNDPDTDHDGWFDGQCNQRYKLFVDTVTVHQISDWFSDDLYLIADDVRFPNSNLDDYTRVHSGDTITPGRLLATRTRGVAGGALAKVQLEGWDDDWELFNTWTADDLLFQDQIDLAGYKDGETFTQRYKTSDWDYEVTYRVQIEKFADPNPLVDGDSDKDGIKESAEAKVAKDFGGVVDPARSDVLVEVDWMTGHPLKTEAKREVVTQLYRHGQQLFVWRDQEIPVDDCLSVPDARGVYNKYFTNKGYDAFRYAVISEKIWNKASGVTWGDMFLVNDSTWWINGWVLSQAGTFIHELGHTMGLTKEGFHMIDSISWISYASAMNYTFQALKVDYSDEGEGGNTDDNNDWAQIKPGTALAWSFALTTSTETGPCK